MSEYLQKSNVDLTSIELPNQNVNDWEHDFQNAQLEIENRLASISIPNSAKDNIRKEEAKNLIFDKALGIIPFGDFAKVIFDWNTNVKARFLEKKREWLLANAVSLAERNSDDINKIKIFVTNLYGNFLFNKILFICDENPPDPELMHHLAVILRNMSNEDFVRQFERQKYALALISQLTPQAITILADKQNWVQFECRGIITNGVLTSDWLNAFVGPYCRQKGVDSDTTSRIRNSVSELISKNYIHAIDVGGGLREVKPTIMGDLVTEYLLPT